MGETQINKNAYRYFLITALVLLSLLFSAGCNAPKDQLSAFNSHFEAFDYEAAILFAEKKISKRKNPARDDLLWTLQAATVRRVSKDYQKSTERNVDGSD